MLVSQQLPQIRQSLHPRQPGLRHIGLELQQLKLHLQKIVQTNIARLVARLGNVHRLLKALQVLVGKLQRRLGQFHVDEIRGHAERERALVVGHLPPRHARLVLRRLQPVLPLLSTFEQVAHACVELRRIVHVVGAEITGLEDRQKLRVAQKHRIRPKVGGDLFRLVFLDRGPRRQQIVIVLKRHLDRLIQRDQLRAGLLRQLADRRRLATLRRRLSALR